MSVPAGTYVDYDDTNINVLFVYPLFILLDEICVLLWVFVSSKYIFIGFIIEFH